MSFTLSISKTTKDLFDAAVDAGVESPQLTTDEGKAAVQTAKDAAKSFAALFDGDYPIQAIVSGHVCQEQDGSLYDYISVNVSEVSE